MNNKVGIQPMVYPDKMFQTTVLLYGFGKNKKTMQVRQILINLLHDIKIS